MSAQQIPLTQEMEIYKKPAESVNLLSLALQNNAAIDVIERLAALRREEMQHQAMVDFNEALNRVQNKIKRIAPDLENPSKKNRYASYAQIDRVIRPIYSDEGMSLSFTHADCPKADNVRVICRVALRGHVEFYQIDMPVDTKGPQGADVMTKTHATASADSYAKRYLVKDIFNIAIGEDDNDRNGAHFSELSEHLEFIENCRTIEELQRIYRQALEKAKAAKDTNAMKTIAAAKDKRKAELS